MPFHISVYSAAALVAFAVVSVLIGSALAGAGGWRALAVRYPAPSTPPADEERYRFSSLRTASGVIGMATYGSCVTVGVSFGRPARTRLVASGQRPAYRGVVVPPGSSITVAMEWP
jgi:hypothetical protein